MVRYEPENNLLSQSLSQRSLSQKDRSTACSFRSNPTSIGHEKFITTKRVPSFIYLYQYIIYYI